MKKKILFWIGSFVLFFLGFGFLFAQSEKPEIMPAGKYREYREKLDISDYWISEKLDGVRARWNGKELISRGGKVFAAPKFFTKDFPQETLDGELWIDRGKFEEVSSITRKKKEHEGWRKIRFMVFDLPAVDATFGERLKKMKEIFRIIRSPYIQLIDQYRVQEEKSLMRKLEDVVSNGGEGLMLHKDSAVYQTRRGADLLKLKKYEDGDARVIGYRPGKGKYSGITGSLKVQNSRGVFYVGSGLSDEQRKNPPAIGTLITYKHSGYTKNGLPRFPVFFRVREPAKTETSTSP